MNRVQTISNLSVRTLSPCLVSHQDYERFEQYDQSSSLAHLGTLQLRAPSIPLMRHHPLTSWSLAIEDISRILLYKTHENCFFKWSHMSHMQTKIFKLSDLSWDGWIFPWIFRSKLWDSASISNHWIHLSFHWGVQSYFQYYAKLANQQNMLQDGVRTSTYNRAIAGKLSFLEGRPKMFCGWEAQRWEARKDPESCCNFSWSYMKSEKNSPLRTSDLDFRSLQPSKTIQDTNPYATAVSMSSLRWKMSMTFKGSWPWIWVQEVASFPSLPCRWPWVHGRDEHPYRTSYKFGTSRGYQALDPIPNDVSKCRYLVTYEHIQAMIIGKTCKNHDFPWIKHSKTHG